MHWPSILLAYFSLFSLGLSDNLRGPLYPEVLKAFELGDGEGAWLYALSSLGGAAGSFAVRPLLKWWDRVQILRGATLMMSLGLLALGLAGSGASAMAASAFFGFAVGLLAVTQNVLASVSSTPENRQRVLSGLHSMYGFASPLAPLVVAFLVPWGGSWRTPLLIVATVPLFVLLYSQWKVPREVVRADERRREKESVPIIELRHHVWWAGILGSYVAAEMLLSSRLALYFRREQGADLVESSFAVTIFFVSLLAGRVLSALWRNPLPLATQLKLSFLATAALFVVGLKLWAWALPLCGFTMAAFYPVAVAYMTEKFPRHVDAALSVGAGLQAVLVVIMHVLVGWLSEKHGLAFALSSGFVVSMAGWVLLVLFDRRVKTGMFA